MTKQVLNIPPFKSKPEKLTHVLIKENDKQKPQSILDDITVLSYFDKCPCGKTIPFGHKSCPGHSRIRGNKVQIEIAKKNWRKAYYLKNRQKKLDYAKAWYREHRDYALKYQRVWYWERREQILNYQKVWRLEYPDYNKIWQLENWEYYKAYQRAWRYRKARKVKRSLN